MAKEWIVPDADLGCDGAYFDYQELVRCGECKWYSIYEAKKDGTPDKRYSPSVCLREIYAKRRDPDWFCADGEREVQDDKTGV